jgi:hypothetical protein
VASSCVLMAKGRGLRNAIRAIAVYISTKNSIVPVPNGEALARRFFDWVIDSGRRGGWRGAYSQSVVALIMASS